MIKNTLKTVLCAALLSMAVTPVVVAEGSEVAPQAILLALIQKLVGTTQPLTPLTATSEGDTHKAALQVASSEFIQKHPDVISQFIRSEMNKKQTTTATTGSPMFASGAAEKTLLLSEARILPSELLTGKNLPQLSTIPSASNINQLLQSPLGFWVLVTSNISFDLTPPSLEPIKNNSRKVSETLRSDLYQSIVHGQSKQKLTKSYLQSNLLDASQTLTHQYDREEASNFRLKNNEWKAKLETASLLEVNKEMLKVLVEIRQEMHEIEVEQAKSRTTMAVIQSELNQLNEKGLLELDQALQMKINPPFQAPGN